MAGAKRILTDKEAALANDQAPALAEQRNSTLTERPERLSGQAARQVRGHRFFWTVWRATSVLLLLSILLAGYAAVWEYATHSYLKGFSDAVIPPMASSEEKIQAILDWMAHGPARSEAGPTGSSHDRDPIDTLNYRSLLQVCGTATNAFVNLADSAGLMSRRLLLLNSDRVAKHVVAEVLIDGRWIVVDPAFHFIWRGADGKPLTRKELADPAVFAVAARSVPGYRLDYTFDRTSHVRLARVYGIGMYLRRFLDRHLAGWEDSEILSLVLERESLATLVVAILLVGWLTALRIGLRWYGERRLGCRMVRIRDRFLRAWYAFMEAVV